MKTSISSKKITSKKTSPRRAVRRQTSTKVVVKKNASKSRTKKSVKQTLRQANDNQCFWVMNGEVLRDLNDLALVLVDMPDEVFRYHANPTKNDFAAWVEQVLQDSACAAALRRSRKPKSASVVIRRYIKLYN